MDKRMKYDFWNKVRRLEIIRMAWARAPDQIQDLNCSNTRILLKYGFPTTVILYYYSSSIFLDNCLCSFKFPL